ncbi:hypothetical protein AB0C07_03835 [Actinoplanes missouriensis]|uniref:hypothetical protein n=1 Tax=Actinoplanes missouriensis TaxID=1866 RepID=UPI0033FCDC3E
MVHVRQGLGNREELLEADRHREGEGGARRHAGDLLMASPEKSLTTDIVPGPGGVMTDEVGVVTGDLTLRTELSGGDVVLRVQYKDAEEWYAVTGGKAPLAEPSALDAVHAIAVGLLNRPEG